MRARRGEKIKPYSARVETDRHEKELARKVTIIHGPVQ